MTRTLQDVYTLSYWFWFNSSYISGGLHFKLLAVFEWLLCVQIFAVEAIGPFSVIIAFPDCSSSYWPRLPALDHYQVLMH